MRSSSGGGMFRLFRRADEHDLRQVEIDLEIVVVE
jgi:hypothetical protein